MTPILGANVTVMVSDMDASVKFYTGVLGLKLISRYGNHWADIEAPGMSIALHPASHGAKPGRGLAIGLRVRNLREAVDALEKQGVEFHLIADDKVQLASFADPDGNELYLAELDGQL